MPLENILHALEAEAGRQVAEIEQATQGEIARIRDQAQSEAALVRQEKLAAIDAPLKAEQSRILNRARLEALKIVLGAREHMIIAALEKAAGRLSGLTSTPGYAQVLRQLTQEAVQALGINGQVRLNVRSDDVELIKDIVVEMGLSAAVAGGLEHEEAQEEVEGGLVASTADGRISLTNTASVRLKRTGILYRAHIAELLFNALPED